MIPLKQLKSLSIIFPTTDLTDSTSYSDESGSAADRNDNQQELASSSNRGDNAKKPNKRGMPKGSTIEHKTALGKLQIQALNHAAIEFRKLKDTAQSAGVREKNNAYANILKETVERFNLSEELSPKKLKAG